MTISPPFDFDNDEFNAPGPPQWAAMYRSIGWQVVPAWLPSEHKQWKRPRLKDWRGYQSVLVDDQTHEGWYGLKGEHRTRPNMGILTGPCSANRFVVDLDTQKTPAARGWWEGLLAVHNNGMDVETVEQVTGGGGIQKLFRAPPGYVVPTCKTPMGVDVRGQGGFAMLPPSLHESSRRYAWAAGRAPWEVAVAEAPQWLLDAIGALAKAHAGSAGHSREQNGSTHPRGTPHYDPWGNVDDLREEVMFRAVWHAVLEWRRECPIKPPQQEWEARSLRDYEFYEGKVTVQDKDSKLPKREQLDVEGRGPRAWGDKWRRVMAQWDDDEFQAEAKKPPPKDTPHDTDFDQTVKTAEAKAKASNDIYELLDVLQIKNLPDPVWLVDGVMIEQSLGFIYGPRGGFKTFLALDLALAITTGFGSWLGYAIKRKGAVIYISCEGHSALKFRIMAWEQHRKTIADAAPFYLLKETLNFMKGEDVGKLLTTVEAAVVRAGQPIAAIFVDTVSRVLPGAEENLQKDMTLFVQACDRLRQRFMTVVIGLHHTNAGGGFRGSTVMPGAGDFLIEVRRDENSKLDGSIYAEKIKDGPDKWQREFRAVDVPCTPLGGHTSLVIDQVATEPGPTGGTLPDRATCREILRAIDEEWNKRTPWCWAKNSSRSAVRNISIRWEIDRKTIEYLLEQWNAKGIIVEQVCDTDNHIKGYRKMTDL